MAFIEKKPGIGPGTTVSSRPLNEEVECPGPPLWEADDAGRESGAWASSNFNGKYWVQEPAERHPGPQTGLEPTSDTTGSNPLPDAAMVGRMGGNLNAEGMPVRGAPPAVDNC